MNLMSEISIIQEIAELVGALAAMGWVGLAIYLGFALRRILRSRGDDLSRLTVGPTGLVAEFVSKKLDEAAASDPATLPGPLAKSVIGLRLQRHAAQVASAHILWVDDHPENNAAIVELFSNFGADIEVSISNAEALTQLTRHPGRYDVLISDVARDNELGAGPFPGVRFAAQAFKRNGLRTILFTGRFNIATVPDLNSHERLDLFRSVEESTFGTTNRADELVHLVLDALERSPRTPPS